MAAETLLKGYKLASEGLPKGLLIAKQKPLGAASAVIIPLLILGACLADVVSPYDPLTVSDAERLQPPSWMHPMGTDNLGRDILSRVIYGSRISLWVGMLSVIIATGIGVVVGTVSAFAGGTVDLIVQRFIDAIQSISRAWANHNYGHHGHCHREYPSAGTRSAGCRLVGCEGHLCRCRTGNRL
jgi:ABC-type dipeptide/oligopeptide/nickel transport system permease subunit